jgi:trans-aconitate 2-methyltransferase
MPPSVSSDDSGRTDWDAESYHRIAGMQERWGLKVLDRLGLEGDETVLDAGCGSGRMTRHVVERVPRGRVIGVDASPSMIEHAREELGDDERVELIVADLAELELSKPVDAIFSNATFHWVPDHERLFARLFAALRPGGRMEVQFGGEGNVAEFVQAIETVSGDPRFAGHLEGLGTPWYFAGTEETEVRLRAAGFEVDAVSLDHYDEQPDDPYAFMRASGLNAHIERLPGDLTEQFMQRLRETLPQPVVLHYVRLNVSATRPD